MDNEKSRKVLAIGNCDFTNGLDKFSDKTIEAVINEVTSKESMQLWHKRFGHLHFAGLQHLSGTGRVKDYHHFILKWKHVKTFGWTIAP